MMNTPNDFEKQLQKINYLERSNYLNSQKINDIYSLNIIAPLLNDYPFLPFTGSSIRPFCLNHILNDILINSRKRIIEFGSGISTVLIARLIKKNRLNISFISIDHNREWINLLIKVMKHEKITDVIKFVHAPLRKCTLSVKDTEWYDLRVLNKATSRKKFDMVIVDGPPAWESSKHLSRYPALPFVFNKLPEAFSIYLDDVNRLGEKTIVKMWEDQYPIKFSITGETLAFANRGSTFYTEPFVYF